MSPGERHCQIDDSAGTPTRRSVLPISRSSSVASFTSNGCPSPSTSLDGSASDDHSPRRAAAVAAQKGSASSSSKEAPFLVVSRRQALYCMLPLATALSLFLLASAVRHTSSRTGVSSPGVRGATGLRQLLAAPYDYRDDFASLLSRTSETDEEYRSRDQHHRDGAASPVATTSDATLTTSDATSSSSGLTTPATSLVAERSSAGSQAVLSAVRTASVAAAEKSSKEPGSAAEKSTQRATEAEATVRLAEATAADSAQDADANTAGGAAATGSTPTEAVTSATEAATSAPEAATSTTEAATPAQDSNVTRRLPARSGSGRECRRRTRTGHCVSELFGIYDDAYRSLWPARVDLLIRSHVSSAFFLLEILFDSIKQMWPRGLGDVILVLDGDERLAEDLIPTWIKVYYEDNYLKLPGKILQQWSYLWADNYTTAPYVALIDDDVIFNMKVTPGLLFNVTDGKPYVIGSAQRQLDHWLPSTNFFVGEDTYFANFMVQLPFVMPTEVLAKFRRHVANLHKDKGGSFDSAFKWFSVHGPKFEKTQIAHTTIGNYMWKYAHGDVHWALEWTNHTPIPRIGVHLPYTQPFRVATKHEDGAPRVIKTYVQLAAYYSHEGVCHALPAGELPGCDDVNKYPQKQIWQYAMDWYDWPAIKTKQENATMVYDQYKGELACMYWKVAQAGGAAGAAGVSGGGVSMFELPSAQLRGGAVSAGRGWKEQREELLTSLQDCITPRS